MNTYLGACVGLGPDDIDSTLVERAKLTYLEGYLWDPDEAKQAFLKAARLAHVAGRQVALTLSDAFCVDRHRASFLELVNNHVDVLFANEEELLSLYETSSFDEAARAVRGACQVAAVTRSEKGSVIITEEAVHEVKARVTSTPQVSSTGSPRVGIFPPVAGWVLSRPPRSSRTSDRGPTRRWRARRACSSSSSGTWPGRGSA